METLNINLNGIKMTSKMERHLNLAEISVNNINALRKKYGIKLNTIFSDLNEIANNKMGDDDRKLFKTEMNKFIYHRIMAFADLYENLGLHYEVRYGKLGGLPVATTLPLVCFCEIYIDRIDEGYELLSGDRVKVVNSLFDRHNKNIMETFGGDCCVAIVSQSEPLVNYQRIEQTINNLIIG